MFLKRRHFDPGIPPQAGEGVKSLSEESWTTEGAYLLEDGVCLLFTPWTDGLPSIFKQGNCFNMNIKIGILSDTHLRRVSKEIECIFSEYLADKDLVLHAGDVVSEDVLDFLGQKELHAVHGNMDPFEVRTRLPGKSVLELGPFRLGLVHGWGPSAGLEDRIVTEFTDVDVIVYGHSHIAANHTKDGILFFNPGTATGYASSGIHSIGVLELGETITSHIIPL